MNCLCYYQRESIYLHLLCCCLGSTDVCEYVRAGVRVHESACACLPACVGVFVYAYKCVCVFAELRQIETKHTDNILFLFLDNQRVHEEHPTETTHNSWEIRLR